MKPKGMSPRDEQILKVYSELPQKILLLHGNNNLTDIVLHNICHQDCLNLTKAAYFVDNADFDTFKGVAGFDKASEMPDVNSIWSSPSDFTNHVQECIFNQKVKSINLPSVSNTSKNSHIIFQDLADELSINNPKFYSWNIKYDNKGILIFEQEAIEGIDESLLVGLCFLGFCPVN